MVPTRLDRLATFFAARRLSRRQALVQGSAGLAAGTLAATGLRAAAGVGAAQDATPAARAGKGEHDPAFLFVQSFQSGTIAPKEGADETYTLTLDQGLGQTVYFSDRPERIVGTNPTATFLERFPFGADNPPNAAPVLEAGPDETDVVVLELTSPAYDDATHTATYAAKVLAEYEQRGVTFQEAPKGAGEVPAQFGAAALFIDDCPDWPMNCYTLNRNNNVQTYLGQAKVGTCGWSDRLCCAPCECNYDQVCKSTYPDCGDDGLDSICAGHLESMTLGICNC
jgi:hypothetical protein